MPNWTSKVNGFCENESNKSILGLVCLLILCRNLMKVILEKGHSRVPVYHEEPRNIIGLILVIYCRFTLSTSFFALNSLTRLLVKYKL